MAPCQVFCSSHLGTIMCRAYVQFYRDLFMKTVYQKERNRVGRHGRRSVLSWYPPNCAERSVTGQMCHNHRNLATMSYSPAPAKEMKYTIFYSNIQVCRNQVMWLNGGLSLNGVWFVLVKWCLIPSHGKLYTSTQTKIVDCLWRRWEIITN